jgi:D-alanyl-D-alanine carboxypeptidase/D-alanyl-D-alanine-endopeptidase (penicillin-binding protein 4)
MTPLREMADSLAARGIRRIAGRIVKGGDAFPDANIGPGWQWDYLASGYAAGVDELFFNEGTVRIVVRGAPVAGAPPAIITSPARSFPLVKVLALTRQPVDSVRTRIALQVDSGGVGVTVTGYIAPGDSSVQTVVLQDPATAYLFALREALSEKGITVDSAVSAGSVVTDARGMSTLFDYYSAPFREVLAEMMKPSQNQLAEIFLRTVGLEGTGVGSADSGARVVRRQLLEWGVAPDGFALRDGSGLTRNNFISPESITRVLHAMRGHPLYTVFFDALPIAGVDGTLRSRMSGTPAERNLRGKTGTLARASALSGYVRTLDGQELIFSTVCNNFTASADAVVGMQNRIGVILASLDWTR